MFLISLFFVFVVLQVVEKFLSKELSCVVTDQPIASARSTSQRKETSNLALSGLRGVSSTFTISCKTVGIFAPKEAGSFSVDLLSSSCPLSDSNVFLFSNLMSEN